MQPARPRFDGWTPARPLAFLDILARTRSVTRAAAAAGMSRESAYRLRNRDPHGLFAFAWKRAMSAGRSGLTRAEIDQSHIRAIRLACGSEGKALRIGSPHSQHRDPSKGGDRRAKLTRGPR
jgi:hypothetical protein